LIEAGILRLDELPIGLAEAQERSLKLGEVLVMLRYVSAEDLEAALQAQAALQDGGSYVIVVEALKTASSHRMSFADALTRVSQSPERLQAKKDKDALKKLLTELPEQERDLGPSDRKVATTCLVIADYYVKFEDYTEAEHYLKKGLYICERSYGKQSIKAAQVLVQLAGVQKVLKNYNAAEANYWRSLEIMQNTWGGGHYELAQCQRGLSAVLSAQGKLKEAEQFLVLSLDMLEKVYGPSHPEVIEAVRDLAAFASKQGRQPEKLRLGDLLIKSGFLEEAAVRAALKESQTTGVPLGQALIKLKMATEKELRPALQAQLLVADGVLPLQLALRALRVCRAEAKELDLVLKELGWEADLVTTQELSHLIATAEQLQSAEATLGANHAGVAVLCVKLADMYVAQKRQGDAEPLYKRAVSILEKFFGPEDVEVCGALVKLAHLHMLQNRLLDSEPLLWRALQIKQKAAGKDDLSVAVLLDELTQLQMRANNFDQAERLCRSALSIRELQLGRDHRDTQASFELLGEILETAGKHQEAESTYMRLIRIKQQEDDGETSGGLSRILERLGDLYFNREDYVRAETQYELALEIHDRNKLPEETAHSLLERYAILLAKTGRAEEAAKISERANLLARAKK
jgi:tetratricopeptide (TPR) repeat protein